jgi:hypothetical protein
MMTRKDYIATAKILNQLKDEINKTTFEDLVYEFSEFFYADNERFDGVKFENACMKEYEVA